MTLSSGKRCTFIGGGTGVIGGKRINYFCSRSVYLAGTPRKFANRRWRITSAKPPLDAFNFRRGKTATVRVAYYGARRSSSEGTEAPQGNGSAVARGSAVRLIIRGRRSLPARPSSTA
jgi:hypothetical protein